MKNRASRGSPVIAAVRRIDSISAEHVHECGDQYRRDVPEAIRSGGQAITDPFAAQMARFEDRLLSFFDAGSPCVGELLVFGVSAPCIEAQPRCRRIIYGKRVYAASYPSHS